MNSPVCGRVTGCHVIAGRVDLIVIDVYTGTAYGSGRYNTTPANVTLNGVAAQSPADVVQFVTGYREARATVESPEPDLAGTGYTPCGSIALTALE